MSVLNYVDDPVECPLCMEPLEIDDINFYPCTCGYQICRFCWHRIRTDENGLCPACRKAYPENPADFKPLSQEELQHIRQEKRQKDMQRKQKVTENRKHLANVRVVQKNLVFVVGLSSRLADPETLKKCDYFGKFGKIIKVVINHSTTYAGSQGPSASAYVTYQKAEDALRAIQAVNNIHVDGRILKASLGTTKYCSHFMKNQGCPKSDCMYLHELGDESASFTKEEMQQGKHQDFEKRLQEQYLGIGNLEKMNGISSSSSSPGITSVLENSEIQNEGTIINTNGSSSGDGSHPTNPNKKNNNNNSNHVKDQNSSNSFKPAPLDSLVNSTESKEGWPSLNAASERQRRNRSKSERNNSSARQTPTEENNKKNNKDRERKNGLSKENGVNGSTKNSICEEESSASNSQGSLSTTPSMQDSCTSSASTTPPPPLQSQDCISSSLPIPPHSASSPVPVSGHSGGHLSSERDCTSPVGTTPSSLSSCSDFSSSLPPPSQHIPTLASSAPQSLFTDNMNSFFSHRPLNQDSLLEPLGEEHIGRTTFQQPQNDNHCLQNAPPAHHSSGDFTNRENGHLPTNWSTSVISQGDQVIMSNSDYTSTSRWNSIFEYDTSSDCHNVSVIDHKDDDLGFDPFEETNKALAEDILIERRQEQLQQKHLLLQQQILQQKHQQQLEQQQQQQQMMLQSGLKNIFENYPSSNLAKDPQARHPPPGFNGISTLGGFAQSSHQSQLPFTKGLFMTNPSVSSIGSLNSVGNGSSQLSNLVGNNRVGVPPGLSSNLGSPFPGSGLHSGLGSHPLSSAGSVMAIDHHLGINQAPPGLGVMPKQPNDPFVFKDLDNGLNGIRNVFPSSMTSVSTMNTVNALNSLAAANNPNLPSQNNTLSNFLNMAQQQQIQQQQQRQQFSNHQTFIHQLGSNMISQKGWAANPSDLTAIDPAIVSSGQLTDARTDSPSLWLKSLDGMQQQQDMTNPTSWNNLLPYNMMSAGNMQPPLGAVHPNSIMGTQLAQNGRRTGMWAPTSPPPGFNSLSPLQQKQREGHKIENL